MDTDAVRFLESELGLTFLAGFVDQVISDDDVLPTLERLRRRLTPDEAAAVVETVRLRARGRLKFARADEMLFTREALEQASGEQVARHRSARFGDHGAASIFDLGCGIGGDALALASVAPVVGVDLDEVRLRMAVHNVDVYGGTLLPVRADARRLPGLDIPWLMADPGRRSGGRRLFRPDEYEPPIGVLVELARSRQGAAIKVAPGFEYEFLPAGAEAEFVSVGGELKECVLWFGAFVTTSRRASLADKHETLVTDDSDEPVPVVGIGDHLYEPDPAVIRAHLVEDLARRLGLSKIHPGIAYLTGDLSASSPFLRGYRVEAVMPFHLKRIRAHLRSHGVGVVTVKKRGSPLDPDEFRRRLDLSGDARRVVVLTRTPAGPVAAICTELD